MCSNRRIVINKSGELVLGPQTTRSDNIVAVLFGCQFPVILRRRAGTVEYALIALVDVCYFHRIMQGEAVRKCQDEGKEPVVSRIRRFRDFYVAHVDVLPRPPLDLTATRIGTQVR